jgi:hypothetical protein
MILGYHPIAAEPVGVGTNQVSYISNDVASLTYYSYEEVITPDGTTLIPGGVDYIFDSEVGSLNISGLSYQVFNEINTASNSIAVQDAIIQKYTFDSTVEIDITASSADSPILYKIDLGFPLGMFAFDPIGGEHIVPLNAIDVAVKTIAGNSIDNYIFNGIDSANLRASLEDYILRTYGFLEEELDLEITVISNQRAYTFLANVNIDDVGQLRWNLEPDSMFVSASSKGTTEIPQIWIG